MVRKICVVTGSRAEFGLLYWLIKYIDEDESLELQLIVTGMHLSPEFGLTYKAIEDGGFGIAKRVEMLMSSDTAIGISKSMGLGMISMSEVYHELHPDLIVVLGDRFEIFSAVATAMVSRIPVAHIHGGEATEGAIDESIRHSITKMAHLHFPSTSEYGKRVIQLGEHPDRVFTTGTPGIDNIYNLDLLNRSELEASIDFKLGDKSALVTFHPATLEETSTFKQFNEILTALDSIEDLKIVFTKPNADSEGRIIISLIDEYVLKNSEKACSFASLGQLKYLSALKHVDIVIGNSSSGLIEAPSFYVPTVNIGDRQRGRIRGETVIDCSVEKDEIANSIRLGLSSDFRNKIVNSKNPYGSAGASVRIKDIIKSYPLEGILKKEFYQI